MAPNNETFILLRKENFNTNIKRNVYMFVSFRTTLLFVDYDKETY